MSKVYVIYWSGIGNTMAMASAVGEGAREKGADVQLWSVEEADINALKDAKESLLAAHLWDLNSWRNRAWNNL